MAPLQRFFARPTPGVMHTDRESLRLSVGRSCENFHGAAGQSRHCWTIRDALASQVWQNGLGDSYCGIRLALPRFQAPRIHARSRPVPGEDEQIDLREARRFSPPIGKIDLIAP